MCVYCLYRDVLTALSTVTEGAANMAAVNLPPAARAFAETRLAGRQSAARSVPEMARRGVVRAAPLSRGLFDREATDRVFATVPAVIQIQPPTLPRPRPSPTSRPHPPPGRLPRFERQQLQQQRPYRPPPTQRSGMRPHQPQQSRPFRPRQPQHHTTPQFQKPANQPQHQQQKPRQQQKGF